MAQMLLYLCLIFLSIQLPSPVSLQMQKQQKVLYSRDTAKHWKSKGRELVEWPTKKLDPFKQSYTAEELKDWYCVTNTEQFKGGDKQYIIYFDTDADEICLWANSYGHAPKLMMLSFLVKLAQPIVDNRYVGFHKEKKAVHIGKECAPDDDEEHNGDIFKDSKYGKVTPVCKQTKMDTNDLKTAAEFKFTCSATEGQEEFWQPKLLPSTFGAAKTRGVLTIGYVVPFPYKCKLPEESAYYCWNAHDYILMLHKDDIKPSERSKVTKCFDKAYPDDPIPTTTSTSTTTEPTTTTTEPTTTTTEPTTTTTEPTTTTTEPTTTTTMPTTMSTTPMTTKKTKIPGMRTQWHFGTRKWKMGGFLDKVTPFPPGARVIIEDDKS